MREAYRISVRRGCGLLMQSRTVYHWQSRRDDRAITLSFREIAETRIRYGCPRIHFSGPILFRRSVPLREYNTAACSLQLSEPANSQFFRPTATPRRAFSAMLLLSMRTPWPYLSDAVVFSSESVSSHTVTASVAQPGLFLPPDTAWTSASMLTVSPIRCRASVVMSAGTPSCTL